MLIRKRLEEGTLPWELPKRIGASHGSGNICVACDQEMTARQFQFEAAVAGAQLSLHLDCHVLWQLECASLRSDGHNL
jgi:hypothetical protein